jgi:hypothetical protein
MPLAAIGPAAWPNPPTEISYSTLKEIEACPRRWALATANYASLWDGRGYPQRLQPRALAGTIVHTVLEAIMRELVSAGCPSVHDASAAAVLQRLGGLTQVVRRATDELLTRLNMNPRMTSLMEYVARTLRAQAPELRGRVQTMLARRTFSTKTLRGSGSTGRRSRGALSAGAYCELDLRVPHLGWKGRADLLSLGPDSCEIIDFKTGEPSDDHALQLRIYALLWSRDDVLNPNARLATRLVLAHPQVDVEVATPTSEELAELEKQLAARGATARTLVGIHPPEARPSVEHCRYCGVRQMCETYWDAVVQDRIRRAAQPEDPRRSFVDVELTVERRHGPKSWDVAIHAGAQPVRGLLRTNGDIEFAPGQKLRVLDAVEAVADAESTGVRCLTLGTFSEVFDLPNR